MEHIARQVGKDPLEIRMNNMATDSEMLKILPDFAKSIGMYVQFIESTADIEIILRY